jgi:hypothetical protein
MTTTGSQTMADLKGLKQDELGRSFTLVNGPQIAQQMARDQDLYRPNRMETDYLIQEERLEKQAIVKELD